MEISKIYYGILAPPFWLSNSVDDYGIIRITAYTPNGPIPICEIKGLLENIDNLNKFVLRALESNSFVTNWDAITDSGTYYPVFLVNDEFAKKLQNLLSAL